MIRKEALKLIKTELCPIRCEGENNMDECEARCEFKEAIKVLEQEPCEDAVSRREVFETFGELLGVWGTQALMELPSVTPQPKTGHWIYDDECYEHGHCSECGYGIVDLVNGEPHNFCRRCGAKMIES